MPPSSDAGASPRPRGLSKSTKIGLGLLLTIAGIALVSLLFPSVPGTVGSLVAAGGAGIALVWFGGILMGIGSRS